MAKDKDVIRIARATNPRMTRRRVLALGAGAVAVAIAAAGGYYYLPKGPEEITTEATTLTTSQATTQMSTWVKPESIRYDSWGGSAQEVRRKVVLDAFEKEYGIKVIDGSFGGSDEIMSKIQATGGGQWDLIEADNDSVYMGTVQGLWQPMRLENIPNHKLLPEIFATNGWGAIDPGWKDGVLHGIPGSNYGTTPMVINYKKISPEPDSWAAFWDQRWKGRIALMDNYVPRIRYAAYYLGQDPDNMTDIDAVWNALRESGKLVLKYWGSGTEMAQLLTNEEVWIGDFYAGRTKKAAENGVPVKAIWPKEGVETWSNAWVIPIKAPHRYEAELLIDFFLRPDIQVAEALQTYYPPVVDVKYLSQDQVSAVQQACPDSVGSHYEKLKFTNLAYYTAHRQEWIEKWQTIMAGG
jgi:spermidine/putrescine transport system substrate-binding protein